MQDLTWLGSPPHPSLSKIRSRAHMHTHTHTAQWPSIFHGAPGPLIKRIGSLNSIMFFFSELESTRVVTSEDDNFPCQIGSGAFRCQFFGCDFVHLCTKHAHTKQSTSKGPDVDAMHITGWRAYQQPTWLKQLTVKNARSAPCHGVVTR